MTTALDQGRKQRDNALELLERTRKQYVRRARAYAIGHARLHGSVTADDVRKALPLPEGIDGRVMGAIFNTQALKKIGYTQTKVATSHGRPIAVFAINREAVS